MKSINKQINTLTSEKFVHSSLFLNSKQYYGKTAFSGRIIKFESITYAPDICVQISYYTVS